MSRGNGGVVGSKRQYPASGIYSLRDQQVDSVYESAVSYLGLGAGGGGAGRNYFTGGSGAGIVSGSLKLTRGTTYAITIGAAGVGGGSNNAADTDGTSSSFGSITVVGGIAGHTGTAPASNTTNGLDSSITGSSVGYGGRGGNGGWFGQYAGGSSYRRSGVGGYGSGNPGAHGYGAQANSGSGGGGGAVGDGYDGTGGAGGSGVWVLSIPVKMYSGIFTGSPVITIVNGNIIMQFNSSGTYTA